jgi:hypothetical protein
VAVAVTNSSADSAKIALGLLLAAGSALSPQAKAASNIERGAISLKYLDYNDYQPGRDRMTIHAPSLNLVAPISEQWSVNTSVISDVISGASPAYHTKQIRKLSDHRKAGDIALTRYFPSGTFTFGTSVSSESDYLSKSFNVQGTLESDSKNTVWNAGFAVANDFIHPSFGGIRDNKRTADYIVGVTQVLTKDDIAQLNFRYSRIEGYTSDPYKWLDNRPETRYIASLSARWNHYIDAFQSTAKINYRYYTDNWDIRSHTLSLDYIQPVGEGWTVAPLLRFYTQTEAKFYVPTDPATGDGPSFPDAGQAYYSLDQRLSAFGAITTGLKVSKMLGEDWLLDVKYERYLQKSQWALSGSEDKGLDDFYARSIQIGITKFF